ncbi:Trafficking kinesin-binding protein 1 [Papilio xuthus]|uniref:Trafficking kinesin-binding protein 1 n=1 Tax=Papilio xuthus TaxID=66420 RepID=A0A194Q8S3_PAPXU|nr:Trafficking kinesin-binding protein 1 [Papilio xuthus]
MCGVGPGLGVGYSGGCVCGTMSERRARPRPRRRNEMHEKQQDLLLAWSDEVCNSEEVPEVEIVSLLQEHIPKYRLRADSLTQFGGYENQDWFIPSPALPLSSEDLALTPDQIRETLNYFREYN